ncbi:MAG: hypothetical protein JSW07_15280 [bacterium]|nr:MAG: hypothetical protein JSW07_15280 [bacterium]
MAVIVLFAKSSSRDEPYSLTFTLSEDGSLSVWCDCRAGEFGQLCKHKQALVSNDPSMLYDKSQVEELGRVNEWVQATAYPEMIREIIQTEKEIKKAKRILKNAKTKLARHMRDGIKWQNS